MREHAADLPARSPGYRGSATNTHSISAQWASGVATAWTLELPAEMTQFEPQMFVELTVADTEPGFKGDTVQGSTKPATLETGAEVKVPMYVNVGDVLQIDTRDGRFVKRM